MKITKPSIALPLCLSLGLSVSLSLSALLLASTAGSARADSGTLTQDRLEEFTDQLQAQITQFTRWSTLWVLRSGDPFPGQLPIHETDGERFAGDLADHAQRIAAVVSANVGTELERYLNRLLARTDWLAPPQEGLDASSDRAVIRALDRHVDQVVTEIRRIARVESAKVMLRAAVHWKSRSHESLHSEVDRIIRKRANLIALLVESRAYAIFQEFGDSLTG